jgi:hypothetical protein
MVVWVTYSRSIRCRAKAVKPYSGQIIISATNAINAISTSQVVYTAAH